MNIEQHLVLNKFFLRLIGYETFDALRNDFNRIDEGFDSSGRSYLLHTLIGKKVRIPEHDLLRYDDIIQEYENRLKANRNEPQLRFKYFQYFALLFSEYFFDRLSSDKTNLLAELNAFSTEYSATAHMTPVAFAESDVKKIAYWMATGSGKTLLMHVNYWQMIKYFPEWENIILITPNAGLSKQHYDEYRLSGIPCKQYNGSEESLKCRSGEVLIIEVTKLTGEKTGEGVSVDVSYFSETNNLVFIDEGHKGQTSDEKTWKKLREALAREGFIFEYSATFGQVIKKNKELLLEEYSKAIIFDYSYRYFYSDGYGKDFYSYNTTAEKYNQSQTELILTAGLLAYYEQLVLYNSHRDQIREYSIEKPLWIFVGSKVSGGKVGSDIITILRFLRRVLSEPKWLTKNIKTILSEQSGLTGSDGNDIFYNRFLYLKKHVPTVEEIFAAVFNGSGSLELFELKNAEGEIALQTHNSEQFFGIINIGDVDGLKKKIAETMPDMEVKPENISRSQFEKINEHDSPITMLIGSKKFIEGWNSWRVSTMGLLNMGSTEGPQIIQLFGRGVRLKGRSKSLKREETQQYEVRALQTLSIFGVNADYIKAFLDNIEDEIEQPLETEIQIRYNRKETWNKKILTIGVDQTKRSAFKNKAIRLYYSADVARRIKLDLTPRIIMQTGAAAMHIAESVVAYNTRNNQYFNNLHLLNYDFLWLQTKAHTQLKGYHNLVVDKTTLREIVLSDAYEVLLNENQFEPGFSSISKPVHSIASAVVRSYCDKFYADEEKKFLTHHIDADYLDKEQYKLLFPDNDTIKIQYPKTRKAEIKKLIDELEKLYTDKEHETIPSLHFDKHLYSPLTAYKKGKEDIKTVPVKMNEGETQFVKDLRAFLTIHSAELEQKNIDVFLLRNLSGKGIGFFVESSSFYPDFILWIRQKKNQRIVFLDPKGILMLGTIQHEKIRFCTSVIGEIEKSLKKKIENKKLGIELSLSAFILSKTRFSEISKHWNNKPKQEFIDSRILFLEDTQQYLSEIFKNVLSTSSPST